MKAIIARFLSGASIALVGAWHPAIAQTSQDSGGIEDIVVTAQKRAERLQDVPITISAITADRAQAIGVMDTTALTAVVPGLQFNRSTNAGIPFLRGIGNNSAAVGQESAVATYVDGVYLPLFGNMFSLNNIERVEVLKGPQGTLFGRNAVGGVINIITKTPQADPLLDAEIGYANYDTFEGKLYATGALAPNVAMDIAAYGQRQGNGWGTNLTTGNDVFGNGHEYAVRSKLLLQIGENTNITFAGDYMDLKGNLGVQSRLLPGYIGVDGAGPPANFYDSRMSFDNFGNTKTGGGSVRIEHEAGWANLMSLTAYRKLSGRVGLDTDYTPLNSTRADFWQKQSTFTQEFQLLSPSSSSIQWIAGLFYYHNVSKYDPFVVTGTAFGAASPTAVRDALTTDSFAGFGQITVPILERTKVTAGLRYTIDDQKISAIRTTGTGSVQTGASSASFPKLTYRLSIDHKFTDDILGFVTASRGFKSGVYGATNPFAPPVRPEILDAYEVGLKTDLFDRKVRFNVSGFWYKSKDRQVIQVQQGVTLALNAAKADIKGIDADLEFRPTDRLSIQIAGEYLHSKFTSFPNAPLLTPRTPPAGGLVQSARDAAGNELPQAPEFTLGVNGVYDIPTGAGLFQLAGNYSYNDGYFYTPDNTVRQPRYHLLGASLRWVSTDERWTAKVWGRNLLGEKYYNNIVSSTFGQSGTPAAPRTYGVTIGVRLK